MNPLKQGLKLSTVRHIHFVYRAFIHESIKTRVETVLKLSVSFVPPVAFIHESIKTRVETARQTKRPPPFSMAFIHESIKTRVETSRQSHILSHAEAHLSMNPLKQGLKR